MRRAAPPPQWQLLAPAPARSCNARRGQAVRARGPRARWSWSALCDQWTWMGLCQRGRLLSPHQPGYRAMTDSAACDG